ncbi:hypothetical protein SAMN04487971_109136 [Paracoccus chinensis]|uniref:GpW protein n=2 Tax=Paracoccus chinensis TaxID=525640 RepID=A0A1G9JIK6_9RHOB|nr:hypothetical protein SAMN04487971_109136 [Paracoccus chinensis]
MTYDEEVELRAAIPALRLAIVSGTTRVTYDGKTVEYRSISEMRAALRFAEDTLAGPDAVSRRPSFATTRFSRGL